MDLNYAKENYNWLFNLFTNAKSYEHHIFVRKMEIDYYNIFPLILNFHQDKSKSIHPHPHPMNQ